jgi:predicted flavoprotein YhiN
METNKNRPSQEAVFDLFPNVSQNLCCASQANETQYKIYKNSLAKTLHKKTP